MLCAIYLRNSNPNGICDFPVTFYLKEENEKLHDISNVSVSNVSVSNVSVSNVSTNITNNINVLKDTIEKYTNKINKLKEL